MKPERWQEVDQLFQAALEREPAERGAFVREACGGDDSLRREVESLLAHESGARDLIEVPAYQLGASIIAEDGERSQVGKSIAHYRIVSLLGKGGMGEVYRARDARLGRDVALKLLPAEFAAHVDRMRRFEREARSASALNHPNILTIYDIGVDGGAHFIASELIEGVTLRQQMAGTKLRIRQAVQIVVQVVAALDAAHRAGIVHRDIKPENVMVRPDGLVKVLDFGLAKLATPLAPTDLSQPATLVQWRTESGIVMGTPQYMSPEQIRGQDVDHRADIFAVGLILYEMLAGKRPFDGASVADLMSAILKEEPIELSETNKQVSPQLARIVRRCLEKRPEQRFQSASDLAFALDSLSATGDGSLNAAVEPNESATVERGDRSRLLRRARLAWLVAGVLLLVSLASLPFTITHFRHAPASMEVVRFSISPPEETHFGDSAISPDGRHLAFATLSGRRLLWVRSLDSLRMQPLPGTEDAFHPFWSPDNRSLGFFAVGKLKKIDLSGGLPQSLCDAGPGLGGAWSREGVIVSGSDKGLLRVTEGATVSTITTLDQERQEYAHRWPFFLPDGRHFVFCVSSRQPQNSGIYLGSMEGGKLRRLLPDHSSVAYSATAQGGYLLFWRDGMLMAQPFDANQLNLTGEPVRVAEQVKYNRPPGRGFFSVSGNGVLAYTPGTGDPSQQLGWFDRAGKPLGTVGAPGNYTELALSPDDKRLAIAWPDPQTGRSDLWLHDLRSDVGSRFTFDPADDNFPIWSPDGSRLVFRSNREGTYQLYQKVASGAGPDEVLLKSSLDKYPWNWSADGHFIVYIQVDPKTDFDIWILPMFGDRQPFPFLQTGYGELQGRFSPDGKWIAYGSNESGRYEVYVQPFPPTGGKWQISKEGGASSLWRNNGKELFYLAPGRKLMAVGVKGGASFEPSTPQTLFETSPSHRDTFRPYAVAADGQRFLFATTVAASLSTQITVVVNWAAEVKR